MIKYIKNNDYLKLFQRCFGTSLINVYIESLSLITLHHFHIEY